MLGTIRAITPLALMGSMPYYSFLNGGGGFTSMSYDEIRKARKHSQSRRRRK